MSQEQQTSVHVAAWQTKRRLDNVESVLHALQDELASAQQPLAGTHVDQLVCVLEWVRGIVEAEQQHLYEALQQVADRPIRVVR